MDEAAILAKRAEGWRRLKELTELSESGWGRLSGDELTEFVRLYRQASGDLSTMVAQTSNADVVDYLNALVARAYGQLYQNPRKGVTQIVSEGLALGARAVRQYAWAVWLCAALFFGSAAFSFAMVSQAPDYREFFVPSGMEALFDHWKEGEFEAREGGESVAMTAFYASNNPRVGVLMNAASLATFGLGTAYISWVNGSIFGALSADMASVGLLGFLLTSVAPHGVSEIWGFFIAGAGGFALGRAMLCPGRRTRSEAIRLAGKDAFVLLMVGLVMIIIAAPIEGFFSFNPAVPQPVKAVFAVFALLAWWVYFSGYAKRSEAPGAG